MAKVEMYERTRLEVEAIRYEDSGLDIVRWIRGNYGTAHFNAFVPAWTSESGIEGFGPQAEHILLDAVNGLKRVYVGDWIIKGENGEFYTYDDATFKRDFEKMGIEVSMVELPAPMPAMKKPQGSYADRYMAPGPMSEDK